MGREQDVAIAKWAGLNIKTLKDPLMHNQPTYLVGSSYMAIPWYTERDTDAIELLEVLKARGMSATITLTDGRYTVRISGGHGRASTLYTALTNAVLEII